MAALRGGAVLPAAGVGAGVCGASTGAASRGPAGGGASRQPPLRAGSPLQVGGGRRRQRPRRDTWRPGRLPRLQHHVCRLRARGAGLWPSRRGCPGAGAVGRVVRRVPAAPGAGGVRAAGGCCRRRGLCAVSAAWGNSEGTGGRGRRVCGDHPGGSGIGGLRVPALPSSVRCRRPPLASLSPVPRLCLRCGLLSRSLVALSYPRPSHRNARLGRRCLCARRSLTVAGRGRALRRSSPPCPRRSRGTRVPAQLCGASSSWARARGACDFGTWESPTVHLALRLGLRASYAFPTDGTRCVPRRSVLRARTHAFSIPVTLKPTMGHSRGSAGSRPGGFVPPPRREGRRRCPAPGGSKRVPGEHG